jgi:uncharacterized protein with HEPN domain
MSRHHDDLYLRHIRAACDRVAQYLTGVSWAAFEENMEKQDAVIRQLEILGEAAGRLSDPFRQAHPEMPWQRIKDLRNVLIHGYAHVDLTRVWEIAHESVPPLRHVVDQALRAQDAE